MNLHSVRSGGFAGIAFLVLVVGSTFLTGIPPDNNASAADIGAYNDAHRTALLISGWLGIPSVALFIWFAIGLYRWQISLSAEADEGLAMFGFVNGVVASVIAFFTSIVQLALVFHASADLGPQVVRTLFDLLAISAAMVWGASALFFVGVSLSGARHRSLPSLLCLFGYLATLTALAASLSAVYKAGPLALGTMLPGLLGLVPFAIWIVAAAIVMIRKGGAAAR